MPKPRLKKQYNHLPPPPHFPSWCAYDAVEISSHLFQKHHARKWQVEYLFAMFNESYLLRLPRLKRDKSQAFDTSPEHLRWLWITWAAKLLGWKERQPEGHYRGFAPEVYSALRERIFPFPKIECQGNGEEPTAASASNQRAGRRVQYVHAGKRMPNSPARQSGQSVHGTVTRGEQITAAEFQRQSLPATVPTSMRNRQSA
jgi:hypothetical protein